MEVTSNIKSIGDKAQEIRERAADSIESAADKVRSAGKGAEKLSGLAHDAGRKLDTTADYVRNVCLREKLFGHVRSSVRRNPMRSLMLATAVGLVAGFSCRANR